MSTEVKVGDKVRVTSIVESVVTYVDGNGGFDLDGPHYYAGRVPSEVERTVEILEPEPLAVGTVVTNTGTSSLVKTRDGWIWATGTPSSMTDALVRGLVAERAAVIHGSATA